MNGKTTVQIRPLEGGDFAQWQRLWHDYLEFYETQLPSRTYDIYFERLLGDDPQDFNALVAQSGTKLVGLTHFLFHRHGWKEENVCYLQDLYADPSLRGTGIGRALIQGVYDVADQQGAPSVYWLTQSHNTQARMLYDKIAELSDFIKYQRVTPE